MAYRIGPTPLLSQPRSNTAEDVRGLALQAFKDSIDLRSRLIGTFPKDGSEDMENPLPLQSVSTANLPDPSLWEGSLIYDATRGLFMFSDGDAWQAPGIVLLDSGTASSAATVDIVLPNISTYRAYKIFITRLIPDTDADNFAMRTSSNSGSSFDSAADDYLYTEHFFDQEAGGVVNHDAAGDPSSDLIGLGGGYFADVSSHLEVTIWDPNDSTVPTTIGGIANKWGAAPGIEHNLFTGARADAGVVNAVRFFMTADNVSMNWALYGIR